MSMKLSIAKGALSLGGARIVINLLNAASLLVLARLLTPSDFGIVAIATAVLSVAMSLTEMSLEHALIQRSEVTRAHIDTVWTLALIRSVAIVLAFVILAWPLAIAFSDLRLIPVFIVSSFAGVLIGFYNPRIWLATKEMRFGPLMTVQLSQKAAGLGLAIVLAIVLKSYWAIIIGNAVGAAIASALSYVLVPYRPRFSLVHAKEIWSYSSWMFFGQFFETLNWRFDQLFLGLVLPKSLLGIYSVADNLAAMPSRETAAPLRQALFPGLSRMNGDPQRLRRSYLRAQSAIGLLTLPAGVGLALVAEPAVRVALGDDWLAAVPFVQIFSLAYACGALNVGMQPMAMAMGETRLLFFRRLFGLSLRIPAVLFGLWAGGLIGAALGRLASSVVGSFIDFEIARKLSGISISAQLLSHGTALFGAATMAALILFTDAYFELYTMAPLARLIILSLAGGTLYFIGIIAFWLAQGKPDGAYSEILGMFRKFSKLSRA